MPEFKHFSVHIISESTNKSKCHKEFDKAVEKLGQMGVCGGDGNTLIEVSID